jgi:hypothetical protein
LIHQVINGSQPEAGTLHSLESSRLKTSPRPIASLESAKQIGRLVVALYRLTHAGVHEMSNQLL